MTTAICEGCTVTFHYERKRKLRRFCSDACYMRHYFSGGSVESLIPDAPPGRLDEMTDIERWVDLQIGATR